MGEMADYYNDQIYDGPEPWAPRMPTDEEQLRDFNAAGEPIWRSADGRELMAHEFGDGHLSNTIRFIRVLHMKRRWAHLVPWDRSIDDMAPIYPGLLAEAIRRWGRAP